MGIWLWIIPYINDNKSACLTITRMLFNDVAVCRDISLTVQQQTNIMGVHEAVK